MLAFGEGTHILDMRNLWLLSELGLGIWGVSGFAFSYSPAQACGGCIAAALIAPFSRRIFATTANIC